MSPRSGIPKDFDVKKFESSEVAEGKTVNTKEDKKSKPNDNFDLFELKWWFYFAIMYIFGVYVLRKLGLTMDMVVIALIFCTLFDVTVAKWKIKYGERTLYLRTLKETGAEMKKRAKKPTDPWQKQEDTMGLFFADQIDYAVMKYVGKDVPLLVEQEYRHATMHVSAQKELTAEEKEWEGSPGLNFWRKVLLRRGDRLGTAFCGVIESANIYGTFLQSLLQHAPMEVMLFHIFEEAEHASVTVNNLKQKNTSLERFLFFPLYVGFMTTAAVFGPMALLADPKILLQLNMYPTIVKRLFMSAAMPAVSIFSVLVHYILPVPTIPSIHRMVWLKMQEDCKEAGIEWDVEQKATYPLYWL